MNDVCEIHKKSSCYIKLSNVCQLGIIGPDSVHSVLLACYLGLDNTATGGTNSGLRVLTRCTRLVCLRPAGIIKSRSKLPFSICKSNRVLGTSQNNGTSLKGGLSKFLVPCSLFLVPCSMFNVPCSIFDIPCTYLNPSYLESLVVLVFFLAM